jgi:hypothetical protein
VLGCAEALYRHKRNTGTVLTQHREAQEKEALIDVNVIDRIMSVAEVDHLILTDTDFLSFKERGLL